MQTKEFDLNKALIIFRKELRFFFFSPVAYLFICIFLVTVGVYFFVGFFAMNQIEMRLFFEFLPIALALVIPGLTMNVFSSEYDSGSYEIISTTSASTLDIIIGKFLAVTVFMSIALGFTLAYPISISFLGDLDLGPVVGGYLGAIFLVMALTGVGIFASSLTNYSFVALLIGWIISLFISVVLFFFIIPFVPAPLARFLEYFSANHHFFAIARGVLDLRAIIYFVSIVFIALYGTKLTLDMKK